MLACAWISPGVAQTTPSQVTAAQIADYKAKATSDCREAGKSRDDPEATTNAFCTCLIGILEKNLAFSAWQQLYMYSRNQQHKEELELLEPHLKTIGVCTQQ